MRPKCEVRFGSDCEGDCEKCDAANDDSSFRPCVAEGNYFTAAEKIAALTAALEELGVEIMFVGKSDGTCPKCGKQIGATTYCGFCGEHFVPKPPKE